MTGEKFIQANGTSDQHQRILDSLPQMRLERKSEYAKMPAKFLEKMCSAFDVHLGKENMRAKAENSTNVISK
jgi:hypothetical protein